MALYSDFYRRRIRFKYVCNISYTDVNYLFMRVVIIVYNFCHVYKLKGRSLLYNFYDFVDVV